VNWGSPMTTRRALIALICVALAIGSISLFMGFYTLWTGPTDCRVPATRHSAADGRAVGIRWAGMVLRDGP
jgi:hypothetical protein